MGCLVWFRSDLRVSDNPALHAAITENAGQVHALFVFCPEQWRLSGWGEIKLDFVYRSVKDLGYELSARGIPLQVASCPTFSLLPETVLRVAQETKSLNVVVNQEVDILEQMRDETVQTHLALHNINWREYSDQTIVPFGEVKTKEGKPYTVFTPFFKSWSGYLEKVGLSAPYAGLEKNGMLGVNRIDYVPPAYSLEMRRLWPAGEGEARRRLALFLGETIQQYHRDRDDLCPGRTSTLSPYLAVGAISVRTILAEAISANGGSLVGGKAGPESWIRQLAWRDFYRHVFHAFPRLARNLPFKLKTENISWRDDPSDLQAWKEGRTGFPIVDAAMRSLLKTGWMHGRLRMIVASFLSKDLLIDWRQGARYFMKVLVDGDLANNNGGWQWAASTGTDATPYFRIFNPWRQSKKFDPHGHFIRENIPELASVSPAALHDVDKLALEASGTGYPSPIVDHALARRRALIAFRSAKPCA